MTIGDEVEHEGRRYRLVVVERVGDAWLPASVQDMTDDLIRHLLWSMPIPPGVHLAFESVQSGQKGGE